MDDGDIKWEVFADPEALAAVTRPKPKTKNPSSHSVRDGYEIAPEVTARKIEFNKTNNPVKTTLCLHTSRGIRGTRCLYRKDKGGKEVCYCFDADTCQFKPDKKLPAQDRICPIPEKAYRERLEFYEKIPYLIETFKGSIESACVHYGWLIWIEFILIPTLGGPTAVILTSTDTILAKLQKDWEKHDRKLREIEKTFGLNPESNFKLKLDALNAQSLLDRIYAHQKLGGNSRANTVADWELSAGSDTDIIDVEATETKALPEPTSPAIGISSDNPFTGEAAIEYEKARQPEI